MIRDSTSLPRWSVPNKGPNSFWPTLRVPVGLTTAGGEVGCAIALGTGVAAGALHALEHHREGLARDVDHARLLAQGLAGMDGMNVELASVQSNIVRFEITVMDAGLFATRCHELGVHMLPNGEHGLRAVTHRDVSRDDVVTSLRIMASVLAAEEAEITEGV